MNRNTANLIAIPLLFLSLLLLTTPFTYQALHGLTTLLHWSLPTSTLILIALGMGGYIAFCVYDFLGDTQDFIYLFKALKNHLKDLKDTLQRYILFLKHRHIIKPHLKRIVNNYKKNPNLLKENWKYHCFEEILLNHGVLMFPDANVHKHANKEDLVYVEGYTLFNDPEASMLILTHAWMATANQKRAIDVLNRSPGVCYFGIPFSRTWINQILRQRKQRGEAEALVLDVRTPEGLDILKYGLPQDALAASNR